MSLELTQDTSFADRTCEEVNIAVDRETWQEITAKLNAAAPNEACTFALTRPSIGAIRTTVILREILWPRHDEVVASPSRLEITAEYITRALDSAIDAGPKVGVCLIHTHPKSDFGEGVAHFSTRDDWYEGRLFPTLTLGRPDSISASVVLGSAGDLDARIWRRSHLGLVNQPAQALRIVGPEVSIIETPSSPWRDHPSPNTMDRSTRLWGKEGRKKLQNIRIGIIGGGGTGSISTFALAIMGAGKLLVWDKDFATDQNRHRTLGITRDFVGLPKVQALKALAESHATAEPFSIDVYEAWGTTKEGITRLKDCDILFCCVDKFAPRVPLNDLAYAHLIPVVDMASWIHVDSNQQVDALMTHAHVWSPGIPCAWCRGTLNSWALTQEAQGRQKGVEDRAPYGLTADETDGIEPSVLPLNLLGVGLALMQFMQVALKITKRTPKDLKFFLPEWELDESDLLAQSNCDCLSSIGLGDTRSIRPVIME